MSFMKSALDEKTGAAHLQPLNVVQFYQLFDGLRLVRELVALFKMVQRFRGARIALAVGDTGFQLTSRQQADELVRNRIVLESFRTMRSDMLSLAEWQTLHGELNLILSQDDLRCYLEDYQRQTNFLEFVLEIVQRLASGRNYSALSIGNAQTRGAKRCFATADADRKLIKLVLVEVLQFAETLGRLRAIATYASVATDPDPVLFDQLKKFDSAIHRQLEAFRRDASRFQHYALKGIPSLVVRQANETQLLQLTGLVKDGLVNRSIDKPDSQQLFRLATDVIDVHLQIVEETLDYLTSKVQHALMVR